MVSAALAQGVKMKVEKYISKMYLLCRFIYAHPRIGGLSLHGAVVGIWIWIRVILIPPYYSLIIDQLSDFQYLCIVPFYTTLLHG
jgi:hypothetical protein